MVFFIEGAISLITVLGLLAKTSKVTRHLQALKIQLYTIIAALYVFDTAVNLQDRDSYWKMMNKYIGSDVMSVIILPIIIFEPLGKWQRFVLVSSGLEF